MEILQKLKKALFGSDPERFDRELSKISKKLVDLKLVKSLSIANALRTIGGDRFYQNFLNNLFVQPDSDRISRYETYYQIYKRIPEVYQAIHIYVDNILSPDDLTKVSLNIVLPFDISEENTDVSKNKQIIRDIIQATNLEDKLYNIVKSVLIYGDSFVEIVNAKPYLKELKILRDHVEKVDSSHSKIIMEVSFDKENRQYKVKKALVESFVDNNANTDLVSELISENDKSQQSLQAVKPGQTSDLSFVDLRIHHPKNVVALYAMGECLGFLVFQPTQKLNQERAVSQQVLGQFVQLLKKNLPKVKEAIDKYPELESVIAKVLEKFNASQIRVKYVPPDMMAHFKIDSPETDPYGESILHSVVDIAKYLIAAEISTLIYRLTRAPEKRIIKVDVGQERQEVREILEEVKREWKQKEYAIVNSQSIQALLAEVSMFEDIYVPILDGRELFSIETIPGGDLNARIEDLMYFRKKILSALGVPSVYLNDETFEGATYEIRSNLAQQNIRFARTIVRIQKCLNRSLTHLIRCLVQLILPEKAIELSQYQVVFNPPKYLQMEREAEMINNITQMIQSLKDLGVPVEYLLKKYLPLDWDVIATEYKAIDQIKQFEGAKSSGEESGEIGF